MIYPLAVILIVSLLDTVTSEIQWKEVGLNREETFQKQTAIPHSFKKTAIQFKTDKANDLETDEKLKVDFYEIGIAMQGGFTLNYGTETLSYKIDRCHTEFEDNYKFPDNMPTEDEKVWSILVTTGAQPSFKCQVNGVEVINVLISDITCGYEYWSYFWGAEIHYVAFVSRQDLFVGYSLDSCYGGYTLNADSICVQDCPEGSDCTGETGEGDSTNGDDTEPGDNHNYSQAVAHKSSALIFVLLFALNMNI